MSTSYTFSEKKYVLVGKVVKATGLRGEVSIHAISGQPENFSHYGELVLVDGSGDLSPDLVVEKLRIHKNKAVIKFDRVVDRDHAEQLIGMGVLLKKEQLPEVADDEYYWDQLTGIEVTTVDGQPLGAVETVFSNNAQDIMVISNGSQEYLVPITKEIITFQDKERMIIDPPPGLLQINLGEDENGTDHP